MKEYKQEMLKALEILDKVDLLLEEVTIKHKGNDEGLDYL